MIDLRQSDHIPLIFPTGNNINVRFQFIHVTSRSSFPAGSRAAIRPQ